MNKSKLLLKFVRALGVFMLLLVLLSAMAANAAPLTIIPAGPAERPNMAPVTNRESIPPQYQSSEAHYAGDSMIPGRKKVTADILSAVGAWDFTDAWATRIRGYSKVF